MGTMWKKPAAAVGASIAWGVALADSLPQIDVPRSSFGVLLAAAVCLTCFVMLRCYQRPLGAAYDLGYRAGRRDAIVEANRREDNVTHLHTRRVPSTRHPLMLDEVDA